MRILMAQRAFGQQRVARDQFLDHRAIGIAVLAFGREDALAGKDGDVGQELALLAHGERHFEAVRAAQVEIVLTVPRCGVHEAGAGVGGDVFAGQKRHVEIVALAMQRVVTIEAGGIDIAEPLQRQLAVLRRLFGKIVAEHHPFALGCKRTFKHILDLYRGRRTSPE